MFDYNEWMEETKRWMVRRALLEVQNNGLSGGRHLYISFVSTYPGADVPKDLLAANPTEMRILIQDAFWSLQVDKEQFSIELLLNETKQLFVVPFKAIISFIDPVAEFGLQIAPQSPPKEKSESNVISFDQFKNKKK